MTVVAEIDAKVAEATQQLHELRPAVERYQRLMNDLERLERMRRLATECDELNLETDAEEDIKTDTTGVETPEEPAAEPESPPAEQDIVEDDAPPETERPKPTGVRAPDIKRVSEPELAKLFAAMKKHGGWLAPREIRQITGQGVATVRRGLAHLVELGKIEDNGEATFKRAYRVKGAKLERLTPVERNGDEPQGETLQGRILSMTRFRPRTDAWLARELGVQVKTVSDVCDHLQREGELTMRPDGWESGGVV